MDLTREGFPHGSAGEESVYNAGDLGSKIPWRKRRLPTPIFWPGEFHGLYSPWDLKESDTTEQLSLTHSTCHIQIDAGAAFQIL